MIKLARAARLEAEKGLDLVIAWIEKYGDNLKEKVSIEFYGDGVLRADLESLTLKYPQMIVVHGYKPLDQIINIFHTFDYNLMPSRFLETFGLTALDFASCGVPTIGYQKGGLRQFVSDELAINRYAGDNEQDQFDNAMNTIVKANRGEQRLADTNKSEYENPPLPLLQSEYEKPPLPPLLRRGESVGKYSRANWLKKFNLLFGNL